MEAGAGFEDDFIDTVSGAIEGAGSAGIERITIGLAPNKGPEFLAGPAAAFVDGVGGGKFGEVVIAVFVSGEGEFAEISGKAVSVVAVGSAGVRRQLLPGAEGERRSKRGAETEPLATIHCDGSIMARMEEVWLISGIYRWRI